MYKRNEVQNFINFNLKYSCKNIRLVKLFIIQECMHTHE